MIDFLNFVSRVENDDDREEVGNILPLSFAKDPSVMENYVGCSVTRFGDFVHFGQLFKAFGNNRFTQIAHIVKQFL